MTTQMPADISDDFPLARYVRTGSTSSGSEGNHLRPFSCARLGSLDFSTTATAPGLHELQIELDYQCLRLAATGDESVTAPSTQYAAVGVNFVVELAIYLSGQLCPVTYPGTFQFQESQLRALVSCLALLHYHKVAALDCEHWDRLSRTGLKRIAVQLGSKASLIQKARHATNVYLLRLVSQYLQFLRRGDSKLPYVVGPIAKIFWGGVAVAGNQYHQIERILEGLTELFALWERPQTKYKALWGLHEYTRLASTICREANRESNANAAEETALVIVPALLRKADILLGTETSKPLPQFRGRWDKARLLSDLPPPRMNRGSYLYGLLDCISQLAALIDIAAHGVALLPNLERLVFTCDCRQFSYKAIEVFLSHRPTRTRQLCYLKSKIRQATQPAFRKTILEEVESIYELLGQDEEAGLRFSGVHPVTDNQNEASSSITTPSETTSASDPDAISPLSGSSISSSTSVAETDPATDNSFREPGLLQSRIVDAKTFSVSFPKKRLLGVLLDRSDYESAGISSDCRFCFYYNDTRILVFELGDIRNRVTQPALSMIFDKSRDLTQGELIFDVVMSSRFLIVVTSTRTLIIDIRNNSQIETIIHQGWDPAGVACLQRGPDLLLALGRGKGNSQQTAVGRIDIHRYVFGTSPGEMSQASTISLRLVHQPKKLTISGDGRFLTCITTIQNKLLIWEFNEEFSLVSKPFSFVKNHTRIEKNETGSTSSSIYTSPSTNHYILCTTAPSSERARNDGEWSFITPIPKSGSPNVPRLRPPNNTVYDFEQFDNHCAIRAGAVSDKHNVFAVLEANGRISVLPLRSSDAGGICGVGKSEMRILPETVGSVGGCLRFTPDGERLIALDAKGRVVVVEFERIDT